MTPRLGLTSKVVQDLPLRECIQVAASLGYSGLELFGVPNHLPLDTPLQDAAAAAELCQDLGLRVVTICTYAGGFGDAGDRECERQLDSFRRYVDLAHVLDCDMIRLDPEGLPSERRLREDHWLRSAYYLGAAADIGLSEGVRLLIENHEKMTGTIDDTLRLLHLIDRPNVVVNFDPANLYRSGGPYGAEGVAKLFPWIANVQVKDARREGDARPGGAYDVLLGEGEVDHRSYVDALLERGYDGFFMCECHKFPTPELPSREIARREGEWLRRLLTEGLERLRSPVR